VDIPTNIQTGRWYFVVGRQSSSALTVFVNGLANAPAAATVPIPTTTAAVQLGNSGTTSPLNGRLALPFLCAAALPSELITWLYKITSPLMG
jgi:hypothetical protein